MNLKIISAGAGSGKTHRLTSEMAALLQQGVRAQGIIATTFTQKAAAELQERVRVRLLESGLTQQAEDLTNALIGTVHGLGVKLLRRFAYEAGVSPEVSIVADEDQQTLFNQSLSMTLDEERSEKMQALCDRFGIADDWRLEVRKLTELARSNNFSRAVLEASRDFSFSSFEAFLEPTESGLAETAHPTLQHRIDEAMARIRANGDTTKTTGEVLARLEALKNTLRLRGTLPWPQWAELCKLSPGAKSRDDIEPLKAFARTHTRNPDFHRDIREFISELFDLAIAALEEYQAYKQKRGLIDYTDMEALVNRLLDQPGVRETLSEELDLLLVDEFQDTSPLQLELFLKLSKLARHSIWVGDPKQSIYGFRGAAPELMQAIIQHTGGIRDEDIQTNSWRSREDLVHAANAIFCRAFPQLPENQVALEARRTRTQDPDQMEDALFLWKFDFSPTDADEGKRAPGKPWMENGIAHTLADLLARPIYVLPKGEKTPRPARPGDVAILCRSNQDCLLMTESLNHAGLRATIARAGLAQTAEARLVLACMKYLLHYQDSLSVAEILLLAAKVPIETIIEERLAYLEAVETDQKPLRWGRKYAIIETLDKLRTRAAELSSSELLDLLLSELGLRRIAASWGNPVQRLDNLEMLRKLALQYEDACNRLQTAASLGGFLLWVSTLEARGHDLQASGESQDAVHVLTYHKSKGLEWPIVLCNNLDNELRVDIWGLDIAFDRPEIDLEHLLDGRKVRYWVNPYGGQYAKTPLYEAILASPVYAQRRRRALEEENRLLYVGITRARDYLVFPMGHKPSTKWLSRAWHHGEENLPVLDPDHSESPWDWKGRVLPIQVMRLQMPRELEPRPFVEPPARFLAPAAGKKDHLPLLIDPRREKSPSKPLSPGPLRPPYITTPLFAHDPPSAEALNAFLTAFYPEYPASELETMAADIQAAYAPESAFQAGDLISAAIAWQHYLDTQFPARQSFRKYPLRYVAANGRIFETTLDLLLDCGSEWVIVQHVAFFGEQKHIGNKAQEYAAWAAWTMEGLQAVHGPVPIRTFLHFLTQHNLMELV